MNILCIGDVVGEPGRNAIRELLPKIKEELRIDFTICNGENSAGGSGITPRLADELFKSGCDILTTGDHVWDKFDIKEYLNQNKNIIRPANFQPGSPGRGWTVAKTSKGVKVGIINLLGRVFMRYNVNCPFREFQSIFKEIKQETSIVVVDLHAETTSEKVAFGFFSDGQASVVFGTHTHIQTADDVILPQGTAYITDLGMTGPYDSVIGQNKDQIIERFTTGLPVRFQVAESNVRLNGIVVDVDEKTGRAKSMVRLQRALLT